MGIIPSFTEMDMSYFQKWDKANALSHFFLKSKGERGNVKMAIEKLRKAQKILNNYFFERGEVIEGLILII